MDIVRPSSRQPLPADAQKVFSGIMFDIYQWEQELFDGTKTTFEKLKRPDTVVVFPVMDDGKIILTEQQQPGKDPFIGAVGGRVEEGEDILEAAKRELLEESGFTGIEFTLWNATQPISKIEWAVYTFIAKGLEKTNDLHLDAGEKITLKPVTFDDFIEIGIGDLFAEKEIVPILYEAKLNPSKRIELAKLFRPLPL